MTRVIAVVGAGYGDEGKGAITDYFAHHNPNSIICRYNGGAQAAHTVTTPDGKRHVFSHLGAGSFSDGKWGPWRCRCCSRNVEQVRR